MERLRGRLRTSVVAMDLYAAAAWIALPTSRWTGSSYTTARQAYGFLPATLQLRANGIVLVVLTALILGAVRCGRQRLYAGCAGIIVAFWSWWALLFAWSAISDGRAGVLAPGFAALAAALHLLLAATPRT